ncbi:MAG: ATP-binding protein [Candidatus Aenigmarchaeota archaeon]|nr:ATP-binding protein [Candidatus Aenigmarchaeota archaeon]
MVSKKVENGENPALYDKGLRLYDTALSTIIAQIDKNGNVHGPTAVPSIFSSVETLEKKDLEMLHLDTGDIALGYVRVGHRSSDIVVTLNGEKTIPHHILVCGVTGAGKSNLGKVFAASIMTIKNRKYSLILFDCESEYLKGGGVGQLGLAHLPHSEDRLLYVTSLVDKPTRITMNLRIDGFSVTRSIQTFPLRVSIHSLVPTDFTMTGEFTGPQEELLWMVYNLFREKWIETLLTMDTKNLYRRLNRLTSVTTLNVTKRKIKHMLGNGDIFVSEDDNNFFKSILSAVSKGMVILIDTPFATEGEEKLLSVAIARRIFNLYEKMRKEFPEKWEQLPHVLIMVEEAHRYLAKQSLTVGGEVRENIFSIISKRGRKYHVGGLYITQMPGELMETVIRQALTKIILPLPTKPDYLKIIQYSPYLDEAEQEIKTLDRGEALVVSPPSGIRFAVPVKIFSYEEFVEELIKREEIKQTNVYA